MTQTSLAQLHLEFVEIYNSFSLTQLTVRSKFIKYNKNEQKISIQSLKHNRASVSGQECFQAIMFYSKFKNVRNHSIILKILMYKFN